MTRAFWPSSSVAVLRERQVRRPLEHHRDLGDPAAEPLAGAQVERHSRPAAGVDVELDRRVGLGGGGRGDPVLLAGSPAPSRRPAQPPAYWPRAVVRSRRWGRCTRGEHLLLLEAQASASKRRGLLHRDQRHQLEQVVLDHVAGGADAVVVAGPAADADVLGHRDLHVVDVVGVPDRLEHLVGEPHRQDVLDRLLAEVVVDPEDRLRRETDVDRASVELARDSRSWPNGFSITTRRHEPGPRRSSPCSWSWPTTSGEQPRRDRQVERVVAAGAAD